MLGFRSTVTLVVFASTCWCQTVVEHSAATGTASGAAAGASGAGSAIGGVFGNLSKILEKASTPNTPVPQSATNTSSTQSAAVKPVERKPIDPALVTVGLTRAQLLERCGEPSSAVAANNIETLSYETITHDLLEIRLVNGVVATISAASQKKRPSAAVMLP